MFLIFSLFIVIQMQSNYNLLCSNINIDNLNDSGGPNDISSTVLILLIICLSAIFISNLDKYPSDVAKATNELSKLKKVARVKLDLANANAIKLSEIRQMVKDGHGDISQDTLSEFERYSRKSMHLADEAAKAVKKSEGIISGLKNENIGKGAHYNLDQYFYGSPELLNIVSASIIYIGFALILIYVFNIWDIPRYISRFYNKYTNIVILLFCLFSFILILFSKL